MILVKAMGFFPQVTFRFSKNRRGRGGGGDSVQSNSKRGAKHIYVCIHTNKRASTAAEHVYYRVHFFSPTSIKGPSRPRPLPTRPSLGRSSKTFPCSRFSLHPHLEAFQVSRKLSRSRVRYRDRLIQALRTKNKNKNKRK